MRFYVQTEKGGGSFRDIMKILAGNMNRSYNGISKQFGGSVQTFLLNSNRIRFIVNGDFYNNGTTTVNTGVNIGIGSSATVSFGISSSSNHYKYVYIEDKINY